MTVRLTRLMVSIGALAVVGCSRGAVLGMPNPPQQDSLRAKLTLPAGFDIKYFATGLSGVRFLAIAPDGAVYASLPNAGQVVRLTDTTGDHVADKMVVAVSGLDRPHGLAFPAAGCTSRGHRAFRACS